MEGKNVLIVLVVCVLLFVSFKVGPILYRGVFGLRGICAEQVDRYKKYGNEFVIRRVDEDLRQIGIPKEKSKYKLSIKDNQVYLDLDYWDTAVFYKDYKKDFKFHHQCYSEKETLFK